MGRGCAAALGPSGGWEFVSHVSSAWDEVVLWLNMFHRNLTYLEVV